MKKIVVPLVLLALIVNYSCTKNWVCHCTIIVNGKILDTNYTTITDVGKNTAYDDCNQIQINKTHSTGGSGSNANDTVANCSIF